MKVCARQQSPTYPFPEPQHCSQDRIGTGAGATLFAKEFVAGINRIQYNQGNSINALAGVLIAS